LFSPWSPPFLESRLGAGLLCGDKAPKAVRLGGALPPRIHFSIICNQKLYDVRSLVNSARSFSFLDTLISVKESLSTNL
jgi:hypothetical protein